MHPCHSPQQRSHSLRDRLRLEHGQSIVEFAVILPVLLSILLGIMYFGRYETYSSQETQLAATGARYAAVNKYPTGSASLQAYLQGQEQPELQAGTADVTTAQEWIYLPSGATYAIGQPIRACLVTTVRFPTPIGTPATTIAQAATMRIESLNGASSFPFSAGNPGGATAPLAAVGCPLS